jgi:hypothetical protein
VLLLQFEQALDLFGTVIDSEGSSTSSAAHAGNAEAAVLAGLSNLQLSAQASTGSADRAIAAALSLHSGGDAAGDYFSPEGGNLAVAVNNLAICSLYVKQIRQAITRLEQLILQDPARYLIDPVVFNLCTLYDLSYAPETSATKKKLLQKVASEYHMDDPILHWRSFRLN